MAILSNSAAEYTVANHSGEQPVNIYQSYKDAYF